MRYNDKPKDGGRAVVLSGRDINRNERYRLASKENVM